MHETIKTILIYLLIALPFLGIGFAYINEHLLAQPYPEYIEFFIFMISIGFTLFFCGALLLKVNIGKNENFVSSAPYAGKLKGLSKRQAFWGNLTLLLLGLFCIGTAFWALFTSA